MPDLEQRLTEWRRRLLAAGLTTPATLDELESHLREDFERLRAGGAPETEAFATAAARLGPPGALHDEFRKAALSQWNFVRIAFWIWIGLVIVVALLVTRALAAGKTGALLSAHVFSLTAGYLAVFLAGGFGVAYAGGRRFGCISPALQASLHRAVRGFTQLGTGLVAGGLVLGMLWSARHRGHLMTGDPRELGTAVAVLWLLAVCALQHFKCVSGHAFLLLGIAGNLVASLAWFGAGSLAQSYGIASHALLNTWLAGHVLALVIGLLPAPQTAPQRKGETHV